MKPSARPHLRWSIAVGVTLAVVFVFLGSFLHRGLHSDLAYSGAVLTALGVTIWIVVWARRSAWVQVLMMSGLAFLILGQTMDISENFESLLGVPLLGADSRWNGRLNSVGVSVGILLVYISLLMALIEATEGRVAYERYRLLADNSSDVISTTDLDLNLTYVSPSVFKMRGLTAEEAIKQRPDEYMTPESLTQALEILGAELEHMEAGTRPPDDPMTVELGLRHKDGSTVWAEMRVSALLDESGKPTGILAVSRDISERKRAEESLRQSEARFRTLVESAPVCIHEIDMDGRICSMNPSGLRMMGCASEAEVLGCSLLDAVCERDRARVAAELARAYDGETVFFEFESCRGPKALQLASDVVPLNDAAGRVVRLMGITNDITEQVAAEAARARLETQLSQAQKMESVGRLAGGVAHDFNNMLGVILGHAELALGEVPEGESTHAHLAEVRNYCRRAADLTRQLLAFSRQQTVEPHVLQVNEAVARTLDMLRRLIGANIALDWRPGEALWPVLLDPSQLDQILANLCVNARDAIAGTGQITITTRNVVLAGAAALDYPGFVPGEYVEIVVRDSGRGMDRETRDRAFEPFYTTKERDKGTGLGLSTVYGIVKQNGGFVGLESEPGQGSTISIHVPRYRGMAVAAEAPLPAETLMRGTETILIVEDELALLDATQSMLARVGYTVLAAEDPRKALDIFEAREGAVDLVLTDVIMPGMNGRQLVEALEARDPDLRILYMSGYAADLFGPQGILDEGVNFIQKPFTFKQLTAKVRQTLDCPGRTASV